MIIIIESPLMQIFIEAAGAVVKIINKTKPIKISKLSLSKSLIHTAESINKIKRYLTVNSLF